MHFSMNESMNCNACRSKETALHCDARKKEACADRTLEFNFFIYFFYS